MGCDLTMPSGLERSSTNHGLHADKLHTHSLKNPHTYSSRVLEVKSGPYGSSYGIAIYCTWNGNFAIHVIGPFDFVMLKHLHAPRSLLPSLILIIPSLSESRSRPVTGSLIDSP